MTSLSNASSGLNEYIADVAQNYLINYVQNKYTEEEESEYYASEDYQIHLDYLINIWISYIDYNGDFEYISKRFDDGGYYPEFNKEWLDDLFELHILVTNVCLK
jgi:hypothetical protein